MAHVEVKGQKGDSWVGLRNSWGAAWEVDQAPSYPLDIRIVNDKGQEVRPALLQSKHLFLWEHPPNKLLCLFYFVKGLRRTLETAAH